MNNAINQAAAVDTAVTASKQPKSKVSDGGEFKNMLSDAIDSGPGAGGNDTRPVKTAKPEENTSAKPESKTPEASEELKVPQEQDNVKDEENDTIYVQQAAVMQMQVIAPVIVEIPKPEIPSETATAPIEAAGLQSVHTAYTEAAISPATAETTGLVAETSQKGSPAIEANDGTQPQSTPEAAARQELRPEAAAGQQQATVTVPTEQAAQQATQVRQQTDGEQNAEARVVSPENTNYRTVADGAAEEQVIRQPQPTVRRNNLHNPQRTGEPQSKFDEMLSKASQELNPTAAAVQETGEIPQETESIEQPFILEASPMEESKITEAAANTEIPETEEITQQETKPEVRETAQKTTNTPVKEQRPQKEISKADETLLGMVQQKQPETMGEVIRIEPAPHQPQQIQQPDQAEQIKAQVIKTMETERTEFQMQLQPEELGKVNVKMILEGGKLSVEIAAVNPKSAELLSKQAESLAASLKAGGVEVSSVNVVTATENASAQMNSEYNMNNFQNQFQNRENSQGQGGRSNSPTAQHGQDAANIQGGSEKPQSPQRILNYSV